MHTDQRRLPALSKYLERLREDAFYFRLSQTIPFDTPIFITVEFIIKDFNPTLETYIVSVKGMSKDSLNVDFLALEKASLLIHPTNLNGYSTISDAYKIIQIAWVKDWRVWTPEDAPLTTSYLYLSDAYKAIAFNQ
jgi:hypothetical protein